MIPREEIADYSCLVTCSQREDCVLAQRLSPGLLAGLLSRLYVRVSISLLGDTHICWAFPLKAAPLKLCHIVKWEQRKWLSCGSTQAWLALLCVILKGHGRVVLFPDTTKGHGDLAGQQSLGSTFYLAGTVGMHHHSPLFFFLKQGFYEIQMSTGSDDACMASTFHPEPSLQPYCSFDDTGWVGWVQMPSFQT